MITAPTGSAISRDCVHARATFPSTCTATYTLLLGTCAGSFEGTGVPSTNTCDVSASPCTARFTQFDE